MSWQWRLSTLVAAFLICLVGAPAALAAAPDATTGAATTVPGGWSLNGTLNGHNLATTYYFEYYSAGEPHQVTPFSDAAVSPDEQQASAMLSGTGTGWTYYYRLVAANEDGTTYGAYESFEMPFAPKAPPCVPGTPGCYAMGMEAGTTGGGSPSPLPAGEATSCTRLRAKLRRAHNRQARHKLRRKLHRVGC